MHASSSTPFRSALLIFALVLGAVLLACAWSAADGPKVTRHAVKVDLPQPVAADGYVGSKSCLECHASQCQSWDASHHRRMTQLADPQSVLAPFDGRTMSLYGQEYCVSEREEQYWVEMPNLYGDTAAEPRIERPIVMTTGSHNEQVYWFPSDGGSLRMFPWAYQVRAAKWMPVDAIFVTPPKDAVAKRPTWDHRCVQCHTTHPRSHKFDLSRPAEVADLAISCEACHGPGEAHVVAAKAGNGAVGIVNPANLTHRRSSEVCGQCHSVHTTFGDDQAHQLDAAGCSFRPGDDLSEAKKLLTDGSVEQFWADGMVRVSGREYTGLRESKCYQQGEISCVTCHQMHQTADDHRPAAEWANDQLGPEALTNQTCTQCHAKIADDVPAHTHHAANSSGSQCVNCHMPHTAFGLLKASRSHWIDSPRVTPMSQSIDWNSTRPNACNLCHLDKSLGWSAEHLETWFNQEPPQLPEDEQQVAASILWMIRGDAGQRALLAWHYRWPTAQEASGTAWMAPFVAQLLDDPYAAVRFVAGRTVEQLPGYADFAYDSLASEAALQERAAALLRQWNEAAKPESIRRAELLINAEGKLDEDQIELLRLFRDERPVNLAE
ncbi:cytochrome c3 family protein [Blastopirellula retiformator]|uniref:Doubled CXXCH motif n=1 Tax=Blastopirellula retiformator TaxID=2527970 RepID=A0A5C5VIL0_9BACT|nr:cytochrome c3 family protein [Blastopirellula retiformator]TWT38484.1 Doubled CXXCH motif [Blastopirellula retiformator]